MFNLGAASMAEHSNASCTMSASDCSAMEAAPRTDMLINGKHICTRLLSHGGSPQTKHAYQWISYALDCSAMEAALRPNMLINGHHMHSTAQLWKQPQTRRPVGHSEQAEYHDTKSAPTQHGRALGQHVPSRASVTSEL